MHLLSVSYSLPTLEKSEIALMQGLCSAEEMISVLGMP